MLKILRNPQVWIVAVVLMAGIALRAVNLTNPPLDFHAWRQLRSASIARGMYYDMLPSADPGLRQDALQLMETFEILEPRIFERVVSFSYLLLGGEHLWYARLIAILFWATGGVFLFLLGRDLTSVAGGITGLGIYMLLPYGVFASRSFQPEALVVMGVLSSTWVLYRWSERRTWSWAVAAGVASGLTILVKVFAVFPVVIAALILTLFKVPIKNAIKNRQVWTIFLLMALIPGAYYLLSIGDRAPGYISGWVLGFSNLITQLDFYLRWLTMVRQIVEISLIGLSLVSILLYNLKGRLLVIGLWIGYILLGLSVPSLIITHDYYNIFIIPFIALSLVPLGSMIHAAVSREARIWRFALVILAILVTTPFILSSRNTLKENDYRPEIKGWIKMGEELPKGVRYIGMTHDYNARLNYYGWVHVDSWPLAYDQEMHVLAGGNVDLTDPVWEQIFLDKTSGYDYFIVTLHSELEQQPVLKAMLDTYQSRVGEGFILYDLRARK